MTTNDFDAWLEGGPVLDTGDSDVDAWLDGAPVFSTGGGVDAGTACGWAAARGGGVCGLKRPADAGAGPGGQ